MNKIKKFVSAVVCAALAVSQTTALSPSASTTGEIQEALANGSGLDIDYARALQYSMYFYDANMCGTEVGENTRLSWRDDCHTYDAHVPMQPWDGTNKNSGTNLSQDFMDKYKDVLDPDGDGTIDVAGGFHDAGDHVEFGMPENYAAATLGWGYYEFRDSYVKLGQDDHIETLLRYFNDYLMKCTFRDESGTVIAHCYQVGEGGIDHAIWQSPEVDSMVRPAWFLTADKPQTDYVVSACASLAINYLNFKDTDPDYAAKSLDYAQALWDFANDNPKELSDNADGPMQFYSSSKWEDDWCWAAAWMYLATGDASCFDYAVEIFDYYAPSGWAYCWNDMWSGAALMWAVINQEHPELDLVQQIRDAQGKNEYVFDDFWDDDCLGKCLRTWQGLETPQGFAFLQQWGSARYNTAMQLICLLYDKHHNNGKPSEWSLWAQKQMNYILGDNDITFKENESQTVLAGTNGTHGSRSMVVGYNENSVKNPHHRAASGLTMAEDPREQKHVLWGALAGGPDGSDAHGDFTAEWVENEVTIDYNAAFVGACAGMYEFFGTDDMAVTKNFPPEEVYDPDEEGGGSGYWVEAIGVDDLHDDGSGVTKVSLKVMSGVPKPSDTITVRYYINTSENKDPSVIEAKELYDQASAELDDADGTISGLQKYDKMDDIYYVEISWDGCTIANSGKKYQFTVGFYGKGAWDPTVNDYVTLKWDPTNDWSYQTLKMGEDTDFFAVSDPPEVLNDHICVYIDGVLVGGTEPDGSVPESSTGSVDPTKAPTTTPSGDYLAGDANCDGEVTIADATAILQHLGNKDKYALEAQGVINGDVDGKAGITANDAIAIQQFDAKLVSKLPIA